MDPECLVEWFIDYYDISICSFIWGNINDRLAPYILNNAFVNNFNTEKIPFVLY